MNQDKEEVLSLFATKYGHENKRQQEILRQSMNRLFNNKKIDKNTIDQLKNSLNSSTQSFYKQNQQNDSQLRDLTPIRNTSRLSKLNSTQQQFQKRIVPFQRTLLKEEGDKISEESEKSAKSIYMVEKNNEDEWAALMRYDAQQYLKEQQRKKETKAQQKLKLKQELDKQLLIKEEQKRNEKNQEKNYHVFSMDILGKQLEKERQKQIDERRRNELLQKERENQVKVLMKQKLREEKELRQYKKQLNQRYENELKQEIEQSDRIRNSKRDYMYRVMKQSETDKELILRKEKEQQRREQEQYSKYGQFLDQIEQKRADYQKHKLEIIQKNNAFSEQQLLKYTFQKEDDSRYKKQKEMEEAQYQEQQKKKREKLQEMKQNTVNILDQQLSLKSKRIQDEKYQDYVQGQFWKEDTDRFLKEEQEKKSRIRKTNVQNQQELEEQIKSKMNVDRGQKMNVAELLQNKKMLKTIKQDNIYDVEKVVIS